MQPPLLTAATPDNPRDFEDLLARILDGQLRPEDGKRLEELLAGDREKQSQLVDFLLLHELLDEYLGNEALVGVLDMLESIGADVPPGSCFSLDKNSSNIHAEVNESRHVSCRDTLASEPPLSGRRLSVLAAGVCVTLAACLALTYSVLFSNGSDVKTAGVSIDAGENDLLGEAGSISTIAKLVEGHQVWFSGERQPVDGAFAAGAYQLDEGAVGVAFENGTKLVIESPAKFVLIDDMTIAVSQGKVRLHVPDAAHGFTVLTPDFEVEDLGTEFGIDVQPDRSADVHVFAGKVRLHQRGKLLRELGAGRAVSWREENWNDLEDSQTDSFATPADLGQRTWLEHRHKVLQDPSLVVYYDFEVDPQEPQIVPNRVGDEALDGFIRGGALVQGRWHDNRAVLIEKFEHSVEIEVPGEYPEFTVTTWLQLHSLTWPYQTILNTHSWPMGSHHWNILRDGRIDAGARRDPLRDGPTDLHFESAPGTVSPGIWHHLTATADAKTGTFTYFVDGEVVMKKKEALPYDKFVFGPCSIGNWKGTGRQSVIKHYRRPLCGRVDELAIFSRAFSPEEVLDHYRSGNGF